MLSINTNLPSIIAQSSLKKSTLKLNTAVERMSTGFKINHAKDNAANYSISTNMTTKIGAYQIAEENCAMGLDFVSTASENLDLITDRLTRLRALSEQAANGTYGEESIKAINAEASAIVDEIQRVYNTAEYNGIKVFGETPLGPLAQKVKDGGFLEDVTERDTSSMTKLSTVADGATISSGTYSISTAEELVKFGTLTVNGGEFVLANDIDLSGIEWDRHDRVFKGIFDGNGHIISNLTSEHDGLFANTENATLKNIALENCCLTEVSSSPLVNSVTNSTISNCYVTGTIKDISSYFFGGLIAAITDSTMTNCFADIDIIDSKASSIGGLVGLSDGSTITNCFATGNISNSNATEEFSFSVAGLVGVAGGTISNCESYVHVSGTGDTLIKAGIANNQRFDGTPYNLTVSNCIYNPTINPDMELFNGVLDEITTSDITPLEINSNIYLQVGINSDDFSGISFDTQFSLSRLKALRTPSAATLSIVDKILEEVNAKSVEYGAIQNRLESALDEISTQYENLVSSRSTLRDADIAEVSSEYIRQQILQQASATLLSTANQTPALALQLI